VIVIEDNCMFNTCEIEMIAVMTESLKTKLMTKTDFFKQKLKTLVLTNNLMSRGMDTDMVFCNCTDKGSRG